MAALENKQHEKFAKAYAVSNNATEAALKAGYSKKTARAQGSRLLTKVDMKDRVKELQDEAFEALDITNLKIIEEYAKIAFSNLTDIIDETGEIMDFNELSEASKGALSEINVINTYNEKEGSRTTRKVKLHSKTAALDALTKIKGLAVEKHEITGNQIAVIIRGDDAKL